MTLIEEAGVNWETLYCPHRHCRGYGKPFTAGFLVKNGSSRGEPQARGNACGGSVTLSYGTAYYGLATDRALCEMAGRALAEGNALRATARIVQVDKDTVCAWLDRVARHCRTVMLSWWHHLHVTACQLDELWGFVHTKEAHLPGARRYCATDGDAWVWIAFAPVWRLVLACVLGKRAQASADLLLARVAHVPDDHIPCFTSEQLPAYKHAVLTMYGEWYQPKRQGARGATPKARRRPLPGLVYAQVVKKRATGRVVAVSTHVVFGEPEAVGACLATSPVSQRVNTSFVERDNLTQRQSNRRLTRRTKGFSKDLMWFEKQLGVSLAYYHLVLPHTRLQEPLPTPEPTRGLGSPRKWRPMTPAMAAGLTDHVWTTHALLSYRVSAACLDQLHTIEHLFPRWDAFHHGS
jgi:IS1 family transposase/transposase-like protein